MLGTLKNIVATVKAVVAAYPGGPTAVLALVVVLCSRFGLHVTPTELAGWAVAVATVVPRLGPPGPPKAA